MAIRDAVFFIVDIDNVAYVVLNIEEKNMCNFQTASLQRMGNHNVEYLPKELKDAFEHDAGMCRNLELDPDLINISDVLKAHYILADYFTDPSSGQEMEKMLVGVRSYDLLASAVGRQNVEFCGRKKYTDKVEICSTLFYGLVKDHSFYDGNKRTALLVLLYQLQLYGYYPKQTFKEFEKLVVSVADNSLPVLYSNVWKKFRKGNDCEIKTLAYIIKKLTAKKNMSYHLSITTKDFCDILKNNGVNCVLDGSKIKMYRKIRRFMRVDKYTYTINFYGWTRPVKAKMARDTVEALHLTEEYPSFEAMANADGGIYKTICDFETPLRRLKDE